MKWEYLKPADRPVVDGLENQEVVYAKNQPEYIPLRCLRSRTEYVEVLSRWTLTPEQRKMIAEGADIFLELSTFGQPLQPIRLQVSADPEPWFFRYRYNPLSCQARIFPGGRGTTGTISRPSRTGITPEGRNGRAGIAAARLPVAPALKRPIVRERPGRVASTTRPPDAQEIPCEPGRRLPRHVRGAESLPQASGGSQ